VCVLITSSYAAGFLGWQLEVQLQAISIMGI
jgi:hypothetical protein